MQLQATMRQELVLWLIVALALMAVLGLLRVPFAVRFWRRARHFGYLYVALVVVLAVLSLVLGKRL
jgi:hypothetical protein